MKLIDKDAVLAIIEQLKDEAIDMEDKARWFLSAALTKRIEALEVKEVDLNREIEKEIETRWRGEYLFTTKFKESAKHFYELGLKTQHSSIDIPNIDDLFEEDGIDPSSKGAKIFKECYYMALEKLKEKDGE